MIIGWLPLAIISYILQGITGVVDRAIVHKEVTKPIVVSFWVALFTVFTILLLIIGWLPVPFAEEFRLQTPTGYIFIAILAAGMLNQIGLLFMYRSLEQGEATRVLSVMGAVTPIVTLVVAYFWLDERISATAFAAFLVLIAGTLALTANFGGKKTSTSYNWFYNAFFAAAVIAVQSVIAKMIFDEYHFISAFTLMSLGALLYIVMLLIFSPDVRREVQIIFGVGPKTKTTKQEEQSKNQIIWIIGNSALGGVAIIILNLAIKLGTPTLVNALKGIQYAVVFIIAVFLAKKLPGLLDEDFSRRSVTQKLIGIMLISVGVAILALSQ